jgi:hypothetical protein
MLSKIKNLKGGTTFLVGLVVALLLVPSGVAVAKALTYQGVEGTSGNKADVGKSGQLFTTNAPPDNLFADPPVSLSDSIFATAQLVPTPAGIDGIVTEISVDQTSAGSAGLALYITANCSSGQFAGPIVHYVESVQPGHIEMTFPTGIRVPTGDSLCADYNSISGSAIPGFELSAAGYGLQS